MARISPYSSGGDGTATYETQPRQRGNASGSGYQPLPPMNWGSNGTSSYTSAPPSLSNYFSDPALQQFVNMSQYGMGRLSQPTTFNPVSASNPALDQAIAGLTKLLNAPDTGFNYASGVANPIIARLQQPGYSPQQLDMIRTLSTDPMTAQRDAQRQQITQRFASQGMTPDSGPVQEALAALDRSYAGGVTTANTTLAVNEANQETQRLLDAAQIAEGVGGLAGRNQATQLGAAQGLGSLGNAMNQVNEFNSTGDMNRQQLDVSKLMNAMGLSGSLAQLPIQLQNSQTANYNALSGGIPQYQDPSISALLSLMGIGQGAANQSNANTTALYGSLIGASPGILQALMKLFGPQS